MLPHNDGFPVVSVVFIQFNTGFSCPGEHITQPCKGSAMKALPTIRTDKDRTFMLKIFNNNLFGVACGKVDGCQKTMFHRGKLVDPGGEQPGGVGGDEIRP